MKLAGLMEPGHYDTEWAHKNRKDREKELSNYELFPMYPTGESLACALRR